MKAKLMECTNEFVAHLSRLDRLFQRDGRTIPTESELRTTSDYFWCMSNDLEAFTKGANSEFKSVVINVLGPWLFRSLPFNRSYHKPFGYSGDYSIIELMYDLEFRAGKSPFLSGVTNCLDYCFSTIHSVQSIWERRHFLSSVLRQHHQRHPNFRVLDVACGGSRYHRDFLDSLPYTDGVELTLLDQDPAAINYTKHRQLADYSHVVNTINIPISQIKKTLLPTDAKYDLIISAGLFDYLNPKSALNLLNHLDSLLNESGTIVITNYSTDDRSAFVKEWFADWKLIFRDEKSMREIFPRLGKLSLSFSQNASLIFAVYEDEH